MTGSYDAFLLNAGHVWWTSRDLFLRVHSWNSTRGKPCGDWMGLWAVCTRRVSLRYRFGTGENLKKKKEQLQALHAKWTNNCISRYCKVSVLVVHHIPFHGLDPLSRRKSTSQEDSCNNTLTGFSNPFQAFSAWYSIESQGETGWDRIRALTKMLWSMITPNVKKHICTLLRRSMEFNTFNVASCGTIFFVICTLKALSEATSFAEQRWTESSLKWYWHQPRLKIDSPLSHHFCQCFPSDRPKYP